MVFLLQSTLTYTIPLLIVALAGVFAERSGIINIALDGIMIMGAFACAVFVRMFQTPSATPFERQLSIVLGLIIAAIIGAVFSMLLAYAAIHWKADQTISGTALNLMAPALVMFVAYALYSQGNISLKIGAPEWCMIWMEPYTGSSVVGKFFHDLLSVLFDKAYITTYLCIAIYIALSIILYKTKFGLRLRSCGEHPQAAASAGINVIAMRYAGTAISGALAGIGGYVYALTIVNGSADGTVAGFGFLALAIMIFGNWKPLNIALVSVLFGLLKCLAAGYSSIDINGDGVYFLKYITDKYSFLNSDLYNMLPYLVTIVVLAFTSKKSRAPKAEGIPYEQGQR